jgi:murein L,D-transpeptidase YafK
MRVRSAFTALALSAAVALASCQGSDVLNLAAEAPLPRDVVNIMSAKGMTKSSPIMMRIFKEEEVLEVWKQTDTGRYDLVKTYEICEFSGDKGPKFREGDRQSPEGFYFVNRNLLNPNSSYHLSFNLGFPNAFDRSHGRTGSFLMVHGDCSSRGCYAMTDEYITEIYAFAREALRGGRQNQFQVQAFPFRMTPENMAKHRDNPHFDYWKMLKSGYDHFELTRTPPKVDVCERKYIFNQIPEDGEFQAAAQCPQTTMPAPLAIAYNQLKQQHSLQFERAVARLEGRPLDLSEGMTGLLDLPPTPVPQAEPLTPAEVLPTVGQPPEASVQPAPAVQPSTIQPAAAQAAAASAQSTPLTAITPGTAGPIIATSSASGITADVGTQAAPASSGVAAATPADGGTLMPLPASRPLQ